MILLGVNIDHVATVRQARRGSEPDPVAAAVLAELGGADGITVHLRADRRHIQERDVRILAQTVRGTLNLELAVSEDALALALELRPDQACIVPERREEVTTEGGLRVSTEDAALRTAIAALRAHGVLVSLFIEPEPATVRAAQAMGADAIELHTGAWAEAWAACTGRHDDPALQRQRARLVAAAHTAAEIGIRLHAGHGISYANVAELLSLSGMDALREVNIGHSIVSRAVMIGMERAVADMKRLLRGGVAPSPGH